MITVLKGDPAQVRDHEAQAIRNWQAAHAGGEVVRRDSDELAVDELSQMLQGGGLFTTELLFVLRLTSDVAEGPALERVLQQTDAEVIVSAASGTGEASKSKTALLAALKKGGARVVDLSKAPSPRDRRAQAEAYVAKHKIPLKPSVLAKVLDLSDLAGPALERELDKLALLGREITPADVEFYTTQGTQASIFAVFDAAVARDHLAAVEQLKRLKTTEVAHQCLAVICGNIASLASVAAGETSGIHPYVAGKLQSAAARRDERWVEQCLEAAMQAEHLAKRSSADAWQVAEWLVLQIARR